MTRDYCLKTFFVAICALSLAGFLAGCGDEAGSSSCSDDTECTERGTVCDSGAGECIEIPCSSDADCGGINRKCFNGNCTAAECTSDGDCEDDFGAGFSCQGQICVESGSCSTREECQSLNQVCNVLNGECVDPPASCTGDADCVFPGTCDTASGTCSAGGCTSDDMCSAEQYCDLASGACQAGCRVGGCEEGETCNTETRMCEMGGDCTNAECNAQGLSCDPDTGNCVERTGSEICQPCEAGNHDECGGPGDRCAAFNMASFCSYGCDTDGDCPSGFECLPVSSSVNGCIPISRTCEGCLVDGCADNEICDPATGDCLEKTEVCDVCSEDAECGPGAECVPFQGASRCLEQCDADGMCPTDFTCNADNLCEPSSGQCVECNTDPMTCTSNGQVLDQELCQCVECASDADCSGQDLCAEATGECVPGTGKCDTDAECSGAVCYGALPGERQGVCVECAENADCGGANCVSFRCEMTCSPPCGAGETCNPVTGQCEAGGSCSTDMDCVNQKGSGWLCDPVSSLCYTPGSCSPGDPTVAPCYAPTVCAPNMLTMMNSCTQCTVGMMQCRPGEQCLNIFPIPGFDLGCMAF